MTIIDAPNHGELIKNVSKANFAALIAAIGTDGLEVRMLSAGPNIKHTLIAVRLGSKQIVFGVNKMVSTEPPYDEMKNEVSSYIQIMGCKPADADFLPISVWLDEDMLEREYDMCEEIVGPTIAIVLPPSPPFYNVLESE